MSDKPKNLDDIDRFWDLNSLLPKKRPVAPTYRAPNTDTVEITLNGDGARDGGTPIPPQSVQKHVYNHIYNSVHASPHDTARRLNELSMGARAEQYRSRPLDPYLIYTPQNSLIKRVEVARWDTKFNFYENFRADAVRLWSRTASECEHVPFFSYVPQYSQLKYAQLKWYLWWRENVRRGVYLKTDFCYILLYIYEIINCPDLISPERGVGLLCDVWLAFRDEHRRIDSYMCEWLCDYCLINRLSCPTDRLEPILGEIVAAANFKEFYIDGATSSAAADMLSHASTYDWRKSRYVTEDNINVFAHHIRMAFDRVWREIISKNETGDTVKALRVERTAYEGALCVYDMKRTVVVEYLSYTRSPRFRFVATDIIKYSENRVRMALGIKSRLKVEDLTDEMRACIDRYFDANLPAQKKVRTAKTGASEPAVNEYDKLYEPISTDFSLERAMKIEESSWGTTELLTSAFEEAPIEPEKVEPMTEKVPEPIQTSQTIDGEDEFAALISSLDDGAHRALALVANGDASGVAKAAASLGTLADALADRINEQAFDVVGDSIIEPYGGGYRLIPDYEGDIKKWLK